MYGYYTERLHHVLITSRGKRVNSYELTSFFFLLATIKVVINIMLDREIVVANCLK